MDIVFDNDAGLRAAPGAERDAFASNGVCRRCALGCVQAGRHQVSMQDDLVVHGVVVALSGTCGHLDESAAPGHFCLRDDRSAERDACPSVKAAEDAHCSGVHTDRHASFLNFALLLRSLSPCQSCSCVGLSTSLLSRLWYFCKHCTMFPSGATSSCCDTARQPPLQPSHSGLAVQARSLTHKA